MILLAASVAAPVIIFSPATIVNWERGVGIGKVIHGHLDDAFRRQTHSLSDSCRTISSLGI